MPSNNKSSARAVLDSWTRALTLTARIEENPQRLLADVIQELADKSGEATALISGETCFSFQSIIQKVNRYSRWALEQGIRKGDVVCLLMHNQADYIAIWLGTTRVGAVVALINDQLVGEALAHCIEIVTPRHMIVSATLHQVAVDAQRLVGSQFKLWVHGGSAVGYPRIDFEVERYSGECLAATERRSIGLSDRALWIYTSGTTGLPKAASVSHRRVLTWSFWFAGIMDVQPTDRMYNCLPLHHSTGGVVAVGSLLVSGGSVVVREKFSAHEFWDDVLRWNCTLFQYIGELCRYLVNTLPVPAEKHHRIRLCCGNGLRADIWTQFQERFKIPQILEFYAATEGSFSLFNLEGKPGAIGRVPGFLSHRFPAEIVSFDFEHEVPIRDADGFCIRCGANEVGEAIGRLNENSESMAGRFEGYSNSEETEKKILHSVFVQGDAWFRTGDLMHKDEKNFFYFVDRIGDTFRWKGENVSTRQVAEVLCGCPGVTEAIVYGVTIPGTEGRAGMAALAVERSFDLIRFRTFINDRLPAFACPIFLRLQVKLEMTATFKQKKYHLQRDGYDPSRVTDPLYVDDASHAGYILLDQSGFDRIQRGETPF